ncbi:hypothetical protein QQS21_005994 [Conoideocrella luteorostrata]|uniref:ABC transporter domain-containing protein n=1 Tax=Conoideocrella luteorostrata TaxID=1105319 RepID=A0AAJ0CNI4_9HYPO|nr:hypothetical protein QQS21_005994 [Conoideocrella luteorostrata]
MHSGKSSLILTLLNFLDDTGAVMIDGVDSSNIPRQVSRSLVTTVSQGLAELPGSVRFTILPTSKDSGPVNDATLNNALERVGLLNHISSHGGLDAPLADMGLSHGQRQLLAIARAVLHKMEHNSSILFVDEAARAVDIKTATAMQRSIDEFFGDCTTISISHSAENIASSDIVVSISDGRITSIVRR